MTTAQKVEALNAWNSNTSNMALKFEDTEYSEHAWAIFEIWRSSGYGMSYDAWLNQMLGFSILHVASTMPDTLAAFNDLKNSLAKTNTNGSDAYEGAGKALENANYAQKTYSSKFSAEGQKIYSDLAGKPINTVDDLANALRNGTIKPSDVPIDYIVRDGNTLILNTRSSQALTQAGIPRSQWNAVNQTGNSLFENMLTNQLNNNGLTSAGTSTIRMTGGGK